MSGTIGDIISAVCAFRMAQAQIRYIRRQLDVARRYYNIYAEQRAFYRAVFQSGNSGTYTVFSGSNLVNAPAITGPGLERAYLNEAYGAVVPVKDYAAERTIANTLLSRLQGLLDGSALRRRAEKYGLPTAQYGLQELSYYGAEASVDATNYFFRAAEHKFEVATNRYFERRKNSLNMAVGRINQISANIGTGYELLNRSRDNAATDFADQFNATIGAIGFLTGERMGNASIQQKTLPVVAASQGVTVSNALTEYNNARVSERLDMDLAAITGRRQ